ncbi:MFS general substrate transporter [Paxillus ammoniavirescens]|nr:MFS general substrate transporter [Paxillus ammoniavirescens]
MTSTYKRRLLGWLSYAFASEVFVVVSLTLFLPICLEQFARDNGFLEPDHVNPCSSVTNEDVASSGGRCSVKIGWLWIDTASFSLYVYSISVALQALTVISMSNVADRPTSRKPLLLAFAFMGASAAVLFLLLSSTSPLWILSALFAVCANVGFGASTVAMNAYLPSLASESPEVIHARMELDETCRASDTPINASLDLEAEQALLPGHEAATAPLLGTSATADHSAAQKAYNAALSRATSRLSSLGIASGYGAGIILLLLALIPVTKLHGSTFSLRLAIGLSGAWWMLFSIPAAMWLPGVPPDLVAQLQDNDKWTVRSEVAAAWRRLGVMLRWSQIKRLQHTFRYLAAWFLLSDGFTTITSTAILFGKTTLHMESSSLVLIGAITPTSGIIGSLVFPYLQRRFAWPNLKVLVILVMIVSCIPAYGCLGFVPFVKKLSFGGLTTPGEMFGLAIYFGFAYGAFQGYARATYAELIPQGEEARWYGLFSITDKSSSFVGPLIVGIIADSTGNIRYAFFFLVFMIWLAVPVLLSVDIEQGRIDAKNYSVDRGQDVEDVEA